jgi:hypothetical protein
MGFINRGDGNNRTLLVLLDITEFAPKSDSFGDALQEIGDWSNIIRSIAVSLVLVLVT